MYFKIAFSILYKLLSIYVKRSQWKIFLFFSTMAPKRITFVYIHRFKLFMSFLEIQCTFLGSNNLVMKLIILDPKMSFVFQTKLNFEYKQCVISIQVTTILNLNFDFLIVFIPHWWISGQLISKHYFKFSIKN